MSQFTPETTRNAVVNTVRDRLARLESITSTGNPTEAETRLAIVILVAEILRDVDALVMEPLFQARKRKLNCQLSRIASCKDRDKLAAIIGAFSAEASRILPALCTFDPANPPW